MSLKSAEILDSLVRRRPEIEPCEASIRQAVELILDGQRNGGRLLVCGNGGSAADSLHIVGELLKSFCLPRPLAPDLQEKLRAADASIGPYLARNLQTPIRAVSLVSEVALMSAVANDATADLMFAQQVLGQGQAGDVLLAISTSGNSPNVLNAVLTAKALGLKTIALTGPSGGKLKGHADCAILAPGGSTSEIQESHLPIYHAICMMLEQAIHGCETES